MAVMRSLTLVNVPRRIDLSGDDAEEDFDHVQPGARGWGEVHGDPGVACQPSLDRRVFVGRVVVAHDVQLATRVGFATCLRIHRLNPVWDLQSSRCYFSRTWWDLFVDHAVAVSHLDATPTGEDQTPRLWTQLYVSANARRPARRE